jgi:hypothetical protein
MKLLLDENLSRRAVPFLQDVFPGSTQIANRQNIEQALVLEGKACIEIYR